ncbi:hypothetical protein [Flavobacterium sp. ov086]|uniref:hypothetical protein n=1 Tax=Flavobacterium sp. ov086 TaxID=1761785 RepID=UPI001304CFD8|nr:hypothetical protein [Flavobacterium sp. ov086]
MKRNQTGFFKKLIIQKNFTATYNLDIENALENIKSKEFFTEDQAKEIAQKWGRE